MLTFFADSRRCVRRCRRCYRGGLCVCVRLHLCMRTAASLLESVVGVDCALPPFQFQFVSLSNNKTISFSLSAVKQSCVVDPPLFRSPAQPPLLHSREPARTRHATLVALLPEHYRQGGRIKLLRCLVLSRSRIVKVRHLGSWGLGVHG